MTTAPQTTTRPDLGAELPPREEMLTAFLGRDTSYDGLICGAVATTGGFALQRCSPGHRPSRPRASAP